MARVTGSVTLESDVNLYGGRFTYGVADGVALFGGVGIFDPDFGDTEPYFQGGGLYTLPVDAPVDLALRGAVGYTSYGRSVDLWTINGGVLASKEMDEQFTIYGYGGLSYMVVCCSPRRACRGRKSRLFLIRRGSECCLHVDAVERLPFKCTLHSKADPCKRMG